MSAQLPGFLQAITPALDRYGYAAVLGLVAVEGFGIPAPGQTILITAGIYAGTGTLSLAAVLALGVLAAVAGDNLGYAIGHFGGRRLAVRIGRYVGLTEPRLAATERFFTRHGNIVVPVARFIDGLRQANGIVAGIAGMSWWRFLSYNVLGAAVWVSLWVLTGYLAGNRIGTIYAEFERYQHYLLAALAAGVVVALIRWSTRRRRRAPVARRTETPRLN